VESAADKITVTVTFDAATDLETADVLHKIATALPKGHVRMRVEGVTRELQAVWVTALALAKAKDSARKSKRTR